MSDWAALGKQDAEEVLAKGIGDDDLKRTALVWLGSPGVYGPRTFAYLERLTEEAHKRGLVDTPTAVRRKDDGQVPG